VGTMQVTKTYNLLNLNDDEVRFLIHTLDNSGPYPTGSPQELLHAKMHNQLISTYQGEDVPNL